MEPVTLGLVSAAAAGAAYVRYNKGSDTKKLNLPPGPEMPVLGGLPAALLWSMRNPEKLQRDRLIELQHQYGSVFGYSIGPMQIIVVNEPSIIRKTLGNPDFQGRTKISMLEAAFKGRGVIVSDGERWKQHRRFALRILRDFGLGRERMEQRICAEVDHLIEALAQPSAQGETVDMAEYLPKATVNIISSLLYGKPLEYSDPDLNSLVNEIDAVNQVKLFAAFVPLMFPFLDTPAIVRHLPGSAAFQQAVEALYKRARAVIQEHRALLDPNNNFKDDEDLESEDHLPQDFVEAYLMEQVRRRHVDGDEGVFTEEELEADCVQLVVGGSDNNAVVVRWCLLRLAMESRLQERLRAELGRSEISWTSKNNFPLLLAFMEEVLRVHTTVSTTFKTPIKAGLKIEEYDIPENSLLLLNLHAANMNKDLWDQPEEFRPERHLNEEGKFLGSGRVFNFGTGRRACLGETMARQTIFLILANLLKRFEIRLPAEELCRLETILCGTEGVSCKPQSHRLKLVDLAH